MTRKASLFEGDFGLWFADVTFLDTNSFEFWFRLASLHPQAFQRVRVRGDHIAMRACEDPRKALGRLRREPVGCCYTATLLRGYFGFAVHVSATCGMRCPWRTMNLTKLHGQSGIGRFSTRLNRSRCCLSNAAAIGTQQRSWIYRVRSHNSAPSHLLGHGAADAAQSSCSSGHSFRQLRAVQASHGNTWN